MHRILFTKSNIYFRVKPPQQNYIECQIFPYNIPPPVYVLKGEVELIQLRQYNQQIKQQIKPQIKQQIKPQIKPQKLRRQRRVKIIDIKAKLASNDVNSFLVATVYVICIVNVIGLPYI